MRTTTESDDSLAASASSAGALRSRADADAPSDELVLSGWVAALAAWAERHPRSLLALALLLTLLVRLALVLRTHAMIDGDEALVGIQAEHILRGERPTYFYGQAYMGSLEAYLAAALFRVFGPSPWALRAVPMFLALLLVVLTWRLALALLPARAHATPLLAGLAALLAAAPPLYDAVAELRTWGGQIEVYVVSVALLLTTVVLGDHLRPTVGPAPRHRLQVAQYAALWGLLAGLGIWINPLITFALVASVAWLLLPLRNRLFIRGRGRASATNTRRAPELLPVLAVIPGLALGGLPAWVYALQHAGENLLVYVSQPTISPAVSAAASHGRLFLGAAITARYASCVAPRVLDGGLPAEPLAALPLRLLLLLPPLAGIASGLWLLRRREQAGARLRVGLPLLYIGVTSAVFCLGTSAWAATKTCDRDWAGRYAVPLALAEPFMLLALIVGGPRLWAALRRRPLTPDALRRGWQWALLIVLVAMTVQIGSYALADPVATFQSPYYRRVALDQDELRTYLGTHHIHAAWANHWLGNIVTFETNGATVCADYYDQVALGGIHRPPGTLRTVSNANRASFILITQDAHPLLARELDAAGIRYSLAVLRRSGVVVITPERTVDPATVVPGLAADYPY